MPAIKPMNVLMVSVSLQGHINPMLKFAKRLVSKGVHVTIATTEDARYRKLKSQSSEQSSEIRLEFFSDGLSDDFDRTGNLAEYIDSLYTKGSKNLSNLITNLKKNQDYSCVIVNPFLPWAIDVVAEHEIPCALLWIQASAVYSIYYRYYKNINEFPNLNEPNEKIHLPGFPAFEVRDLPSFVLPSCPEYFRRIFTDLFKSLDKVKWVLGTSFYEAEEEIVKSMASITPFYPIGPLVSPFLLGEKETDSVSVDMWKAEDSCMEWLDKMPYSSVIYVSFGSLIVLSPKQMNNLATALKNSNRAFLWVLNPAADRKSNNNENGSEFLLPRGFVEETKGRGLVVKWCSQEKVLMHPAIACFVSHCGWNSTLETLVTGVPVIGCPDWTDQPTNAMLIESVFGNGARAKREDGDEDWVASAEEIERCIWDVMEGPYAAQMKKRALEIKELARESLQEGGTSDKNLNQFISSMVVGNTKKV